MSDLTTLRTAVDTKLNTLVWTWKPLVEVFDYHTLDNTGFPYVTFEPSSLDSSFEDTCNNLRNYTFDVFIYQEITCQWRQGALNILINSFQQIIDAFDEDYTLWGAADAWVNAVWGEFWQLVNEDWKTLFANIKINAKFLANLKD